MYCRTCGKEVRQQAVVCVSCGCDPLAGNKFCPSCGAETNPSAVACIKCGAGLTQAMDAKAGAKPWKAKAIAGMRLGSGICNILAGLVFCWLFVPVLLIPLGIIEIISAANLMSDKPRAPSGMKTIAVLEIVGIVTLAGWIPLAVGILTLVWLSDPEVERYFASLPIKT